MNKRVAGLALKVVVAAAALTMVAGAAQAQRDPAYQQARTQGLIGEKPDGYLGYIAAPSAAVRALVEDINIKRKAAYTREASSAGSTVEQFAFTTGCRLIQQAAQGEKYQTPGGQWATRDGGAATRDPRCP